ncbi:CDP-alcohol phosphatidyltransferase family protein, partial [Candidatus Sumerlaeota bacterium]|nr:CDP-alcohol phosphatidyltransferase family protein [Candidatus Sumerlaeota bacterium]
MNIANKLTFLRVLLLPFFMFFLLFDHPDIDPLYMVILRFLALIVFIVASFTDLIDGYLARKYNLVTNFGRLFDPLADKMLVTVAFVGFV